MAHYNNNYMHVNNMQRGNPNSSNTSNVYYSNYGPPRGPVQPMRMSANDMNSMQQIPNVNMNNQGRMMSNPATRQQQMNIRTSYNPQINPNTMGNIYNTTPQHQYPVRQTHPPHIDNNSNQNSFESEFPALGGGRSSNQRSNEKQREYTINQDEFPALGGGNTQSTNTSSRNETQQDNNYSSRNQNQSRQYNPIQQNSSTQNPNDNRYGLLGLLKLIHNPEPENLALGIDLTTLGLNLSTPNPLYTSFGSPFTDARTSGIDKGSMRSYKQPKMQPVQEKLSNFEESTLFFMFYGIPQDEMQLLASEALAKKGWGYNKKDRHFYKPIPADSKTGIRENSFYCFEPTTWKTIIKTNYTLYRQDFELKAP